MTNQAEHEYASRGVDRLFRVLAATYGAAWERSIGEVPLTDAKSRWSQVLAPYLQLGRPNMAIQWALQRLPARCPNSIEFYNLCCQAPPTDLPIENNVAADPKCVADGLVKVAELRASLGRPLDHRLWSEKITSRHLAGEKLNPTVLQMALRARGDR